MTTVDSPTTAIFPAAEGARWPPTTPSPPLARAWTGSPSHLPAHYGSTATVLALDAVALSRAHFAVSPMSELLAIIARHAGALGPTAARAYRRSGSRFTSADTMVLRGLLGALRRTRWSMADLLSPSLLDRSGPLDLDEELKALRVRMLGGDAPGQHPLPVDHASAVLAALRTAFAAWLADDWSVVRRTLEDDVVHRAHVLARRGTAHLLDTLHENVHYADQRLYVKPPSRCGSASHFAWPAERAVDRLLLVPSTVVPHPTVLGGDDTPMLCYPVSAGYAQSQECAGEEIRPAAELMGRARSNALAAIGTGCSTTELAERLGVGPATASSHAATLRRAGLLATRRRGKRVEHRLTELGVRLLEANRS
ncbi:helix-turn-helix domain-containing protein [Salinactinospora qingdaonensis]|uniref:HTH arsR-type domain-containing protein n=1 Tax=Salinactinospora qingdaonensis TaxID=702744 RepID=A0ABP7EWP4_9ACTN